MDVREGLSVREVHYYKFPMERDWWEILLEKLIIIRLQHESNSCICKILCAALVAILLTPLDRAPSY